MHRVKGLEFNRMVIAGMNDDAMPLSARIDASDDNAARRDAELMERALLYVALTRARKAALVTCHAKISPWLASPRYSAS